MDHTFQPPLQLVAARGLGSDQWFVSRSELLHYRASSIKTSQEALSKLYPLLPGWNRGNPWDDLGSHRFKMTEHLSAWGSECLCEERLLSQCVPCAVLSKMETCILLFPSHYTIGGLFVIAANPP